MAIKPPPTLRTEHTRQRRRSTTIIDDVIEADGETVGEASTQAQERQLGQFLKYNIPVNVFITAAVFAMWYFTRFWTLLVITTLVFSYIIGLLVARGLVRRHRIEGAVFCIAGGAVVLDLVGQVLSGGTVLPTMALLTLWPVVLALPYVRRRSLFILMIVSTATAMLLAILQWTGDPVGVRTSVPLWLSLAANSFCIPVFVGFICLVIWHYGSQLHDAVAQLRLANASLRESERALEQRVEERTIQLARQNEQLTRLDEMKTRFVSTASHELRSPLSSIRAFSELLTDDPDLNETQLEFARAINAESERLTRLASELLDLSRIQSGVVDWHPLPLDLHVEMGKLAELQARPAQLKGILLEFDLPNTLPRVSADPDALHQVLLNLTNNAIKFTLAGRVVVSALSVDNAVRITVADTGLGISETDQRHIFDRFYQAGNVLTEKPAGAGLGLPICREILAQHGSELHVESELGLGSRFSFDLPLAGGEPQASRSSP